MYHGLGHQVATKGMKSVALVVFTGIMILNSTKDIQAQDQFGSNLSEVNEINRNLERIFRHLDDDATQVTVNTYIGTIALLVSLALVIFGFKLSREGRLSHKAVIYSRVLVLSLILPVIFLIVAAWFSLKPFLYPD